MDRILKEFAAIWNFPLLVTLVVNFYLLKRNQLILKTLDQGWFENDGDRAVKKATFFEVQQDLMEKSINKSYLQYPEEPPPKDKAITDRINLIKNSNNLLRSVVNFWNESFYW